MLVLRAGDAPGQLELTVSTQGMETQMLQIPADRLHPGPGTPDAPNSHSVKRVKIALGLPPCAAALLLSGKGQLNFPFPCTIIDITWRYVQKGETLLEPYRLAICEDDPRERQSLESLCRDCSSP